MKRLLTLMLCLSLAALARAQEAVPAAPPAAAPAAPTPPPEEDVIYFKDGGMLRGTALPGNRKRKTGRIQLRDGNIFVYKMATIKMSAKEPVEIPNAKEDSIKVALIAKKVIEGEQEAEREKRRREEEVNSLQKMIDGNRAKSAAQKEKKDEGGDGEGFRLYSSLEVLGGLGLNKLPAVDDTTPALDNKQRIVGFHYAVGGRTDFFAIGLNMGLHQTHRSLSVISSLLQNDSIPTTTLSMPIGLDMRVEFAPNAGVSPYIGITGGYALSLTEGVNSYVVFNPSLGFRFGKKDTRSQLSVGYLMQMDGNRQTSYLALKFGIIF